MCFRADSSRAIMGFHSIRTESFFKRFRTVEKERYKRLEYRSHLISRLITVLFLQ